jgi:hypothetical protein
MPRRLPAGIRIARNAPTKLYPFARFFRGFERNPAIQRLFGRATRRVLRGQKVEFFSSPFGYMGTSDRDGHLIISTHHLKTSDLRTIYLDLVHELCHVRQFRRGQRLFYPKLSYVDAPSEIEAYRFTVEEGRRIGMTDAELLEYLKVHWISEAEHRRLARHTGIEVRRPKPARRRRATARRRRR